MATTARQPRTEIERQPRKLRECQYSQEELDAQAEAHLAYEQYMEEGYQEARDRRIAENQAEWEEWREQRRQQRAQEQEEQQRLRDEYWEEHPEAAPWQWRKVRGIGE